MNCPHCHQPIDPALVRKAANSIAGSAKRPGALNKPKNRWGRAGKPASTLCDVCHHPLLFPADEDPIFKGDRTVTSLCRHMIRVR